MTWAAARDPFWQVRSYLMRWRWTTARRAGQWLLLDGSRVIAREPELHRMVRRIRILAVSAESMRRIKADQQASPPSCTEVATDNDNRQPAPTPDHSVYTLRTGT